MKTGQQKGGQPGHGVRRGDTVAAVIRTDPDTMAALRAKACRDGTSLAEAIRTIIEWGLEAEEENACP